MTHLKGTTVVGGRNASLVLPDLPAFQKMLKMQIFVKCEIFQIFNMSSIENNSNIVNAGQRPNGGQMRLPVCSLCFRSSFKGLERGFSHSFP